MASPSPTTTQSTDWLKCVLCQVDSKEPLTCPTDTGYNTTAENIDQFNELQCMPVQIDVTRLDHGHGVECTFKEQNAKWHESCYLKFGKSKLERAKERKQKSAEEPTTSKRIFTSSSTGGGESDTSTHVGSETPVCFFCSKPETAKEKLHEVCTFQLDYRVRKCAQEIQDEALLVKLSTGDLIALEAKYHARCLTNLYNRARGKVPQIPCITSDQTCKGTALAELISYIEERRQDEGIMVFKPVDLTKLYSARLDQLGVDVATQVNSKHLKDRILMHLPDLKAYKKGRDVFMAYEDDVGTFLRQGYQTDRDEQSIMMTQIANSIRRNIFTQEVTFSGSFAQSSQVESVPQSFLSFVSMLINGPNIMDQACNKNLYVNQCSPSLNCWCPNASRGDETMEKYYMSFTTKIKTHHYPSILDLRSMH